MDAAHSQKEKMTEIQGIDLATGKPIFYKELGNQTINIGEFLAIVEAAKYIIANDYEPKVIFSDSNTGIAWFRNKMTASGKRNKMLQKAEAYLRIASFWVDRIKVIKWDNKAYGEIPADFGNK